jgi:hypothetical protein
MHSDHTMTSDRTGAKSADPDRADPDQDEKAAAATDKRSKLDNLLDEALEATFPASDPISITQPGR